MFWFFAHQCKSQWITLRFASLRVQQNLHFNENHSFNYMLNILYWFTIVVFFFVHNHRRNHHFMVKNDFIIETRSIDMLLICVSITKLNFTEYEKNWPVFIRLNVTVLVFNALHASEFLCFSAPCWRCFCCCISSNAL